jgi:hypothetical protein
MEKKETVEVKNIVLKIDDKEISLSLGQAKKLKDLLGEMFGISNTVYVPIDRYIPYEPYRPWPQYPQVTWCSNTTSELSITL